MRILRLGWDIFVYGLPKRFLGKPYLPLPQHKRNYGWKFSAFINYFYKKTIRVPKDFISDIRISESLTMISNLHRKNSILALLVFVL